MASNYKTNDCKDLDERYLGINAKAKSASTADSVSYTNVSGRPSGMQFGGKYSYDSGQNKNMSLSWSAPNDLIGYISATSHPGYNGNSSGDNKDAAHITFRIGSVVIANNKSGWGKMGETVDYVFLKRGTVVQVSGTKGTTVPGAAYVQLTFNGSICSLS